MLTHLILKLSVPGYGGKLSTQSRMRCGIVSGIIGIIFNTAIAALKMILAICSGSIAMAADAVNNISDAGSGVIAATGFHLSSRPADADHPFGHGRTEYVAGLIVALLVFGLGMTFLKDSIVALFKPSKITADNTAIIIFSSTVLVKCWMFFFYMKVAKLINSDVIKASAYDSLSDCLGTVVVILSLIFGRYTSFPLDGCAGIIVAIMILFAGGSVLKDIISKLLGETPDREFVEKVRSASLECPGIDGVHDIMVHNYGENYYFVTAHAEISDEGDRLSAHDILENAEVAVGKNLSVELLLHGDPYDKSNPEVILWRSRVENIVSVLNQGLKVYDFKLEKSCSGKIENICFHLLQPHCCTMSAGEIENFLQTQMSKYDPEITLVIRFIRSFV